MKHTFRKNTTGITCHFHISKIEENVFSIFFIGKKIPLLRTQYVRKIISSPLGKGFDKCPVSNADSYDY